MKNNHLAQAWLVLLLAVGFGGGLAAVQISLDPMIRRNRLAETAGQIPHLVPGAVTGVVEQVGGRFAYRAENGDGDTVGWVLPTAGQGFADRIDVLLGLDAQAARLTGVYVLDQKETPGLGNKIVEETWRSQFKGREIGSPFVVTKSAPTSDRQIEGVTGATISSESVVDIVNRAASEFRTALAAAGGTQGGAAE